MAPTIEEIMKKEQKEKKKQKEMNKQRMKQLLYANADEDRNIKHLEKQLKLNKRKSKSVPKSFTGDGLDYLLEVCASKTMNSAVANDQELNEVNNEFEEDSYSEEDFSDEDQQTDSELEDLEDELQEESSEDETDLEEEEEEEEEIVSTKNSNYSDKVKTRELESPLEEHDDKGNTTSKKRKKATISDISKKKPKLESNSSSEDESTINKCAINKKEDGTWEDIYGRLRSGDGAIIGKNEEKFIPPTLRAKMEADTSEDKTRIEKLSRQLTADEREQWWLVGLAWTGNNPENAEKTDVRRNRSGITSAEDYVNAFERCLGLDLKNLQEREIMNIILHCCLQEKEYIPCYAVLAQKFCEYDRKYQMNIKCLMREKLKSLSKHSGSQLSNLAKMLTHLFIEKGLPISTLKIVEFSNLDNTTLRFMRQILLGILLQDDLEACLSIFEKVGQSEKLKMFRESLRLFIHHFILHNMKFESIAEEQKTLFRTRAKLVEKILIPKDN